MTDIYLRPANQEYPDPVHGEVKGHIPKWLNGTLLRNGPGIFQIGSMEFNHLFDSLSVIHRFNITDGEVTYQNKYLQSDSFKQDKSANKIVVTEFGTRGVPDPCKNIFQRYFSYFFPLELTDNDLVNFNVYGDNEIYVSSETNRIHRIDPSNLETKEKVNLGDYIKIFTITPHSHTDRDGNVYNIGNSSIHLLTRMKYCIVKFPPSKINDKVKELNPFNQASIISEITSDRRFGMSYFHSFAITDNFIVFVEQPLYFNFKNVLLKFLLRLQPPISTLTWDAKHKVLIHVVNKHTGKRLDTKYVADPFAFFHHINAYEEKEYLIMDLVCANNPNYIWACTVENLKSKDAFKNIDIGKAKRFVIPLHIPKMMAGTNMVTLPYTKAMAIIQKNNQVLLIPEILSNFDLELPRINYEYFNGRRYNFLYAVQFNATHSFQAALIKVDIENKTEILWQEADCFPSEPVFVSRPGAVEEDDGLVLSVILRYSSYNTAFLLILDAKSFCEIGRSEFKIQIPKDFHGIFLTN